jgi:hypothetical protein
LALIAISGFAGGAAIYQWNISGHSWWESSGEAAGTFNAGMTGLSASLIAAALAVDVALALPAGAMYLGANLNNAGMYSWGATQSGLLPNVAANSASALQQNYQRGLQLAEGGQITENVNFFKHGLSDAAVPDDIPVADIRSVLGSVGNIYVVGKPGPGRDLDLIVVGEKAAQFSADQLQAINAIAQQAGFSDAHVQAMTFLQAAAFRFATQPTSPLHAVPNLRNPMLWRLITGE